MPDGTCKGKDAHQHSTLMYAAVIHWQCLGVWSGDPHLISPDLSSVDAPDTRAVSSRFKAHLPAALQVKESLLKSGLVGDNVYCHILSGLGAGFFAVICGSPVDVVKSRLMGAVLRCHPVTAHVPGVWNWSRQNLTS